MDSMRLDLLEKKLDVMQGEVSQVLAQMQTTVQALAKMMQVGMRVMDERLSALEPKKEAEDAPKSEG